jgi:hypothetical protein
VFDSNLGVSTRPSHMMLKSDLHPATFWTATPQNLWRNNIATDSAARGDLQPLLCAAFLLTSLLSAIRFTSTLPSVAPTCVTRFTLLKFGCSCSAALSNLLACLPSLLFTSLAALTSPSSVVGRVLNHSRLPLLTLNLNCMLHSSTTGAWFELTDSTGPTYEFFNNSFHHNSGIGFRNYPDYSPASPQFFHNNSYVSHTVFPLILLRHIHHSSVYESTATD